MKNQLCWLPSSYYLRSKYLFLGNPPSLTLTLAHILFRIKILIKNKQIFSPNKIFIFWDETGKAGIIYPKHFIIILAIYIIAFNKKYTC